MVITKKHSHTHILSHTSEVLYNLVLGYKSSFRDTHHSITVINNRLLGLTSPNNDLFAIGVISKAEKCFHPTIEIIKETNKSLQIFILQDICYNHNCYEITHQ